MPLLVVSFFNHISSWPIKTAAVEAEESMPGGVQDGEQLGFPPYSAPPSLAGPMKAGGVQLLEAFRGKGYGAQGLRFCSP